jgi:CMP-N-acetylneuraminic acid synthetase
MENKAKYKRVHFYLTENQHIWLKEQKYIRNLTGQEIMNKAINAAIACSIFEPIEPQV